jgi:Kef-type K+ transport system membrane component KefB
MKQAVTTIRTARIGRVAAITVMVVGLTAVAAWQLPRSSAHEIEPLNKFLLAAALILLVCHLLGTVAVRLRQPRVVGEVVGGLLLGPSALGLVWPAGSGWLFPDSVHGLLSASAQLGLTVFMFLLGCELRLDTTRCRPRQVTMVAVGAMGLPFLVGLVVAVAAGTRLVGSANPMAAYVFVALALSITALPVLGRILVDLGMERTEVGRMSLAAAAIGDGAAWCVLTVILVSTGAAASQALLGLVAASGFVGVMLLVVRPVLVSYIRRLESHGRTYVLLPALVTIAIGAAAAAQSVGLHPFIGAFLFGVAVPSGSPVVHQLNHQLRGFTTVVLLPLFFAVVGLSTSVGLLGPHPSHWLLLGAVVVVATVTKLVGAATGAWLGGWQSRDALVIGALMNCRGVTELIVASIGLQAGLINGLGFTVLVLMALFTTAITGPMVKLFGHLRPSVDNDQPVLPDQPVRSLGE